MRFVARGATVLAFVLLVAGSIVHQTGSSLACPDWPLCNGMAFPPMTGGILFEHTHRLIALALVIVVGILVAASRRHADRAVRIHALACAGLIAVQALLGATTVLLRLPPIVSVAHLVTAMSLLSLLAWIAGRTGSPRSEGSALWVLALVIAQCGLGAVVRHAGAALACRGFPTCNGTFVPDGALARFQMLHRVLAVVVLGVLALRWRSSPIALVLGLLQAALGVAVVTGYDFGRVTLHHAIGAAMVIALGYACGQPSKSGNVVLGASAAVK